MLSRRVIQGHEGQHQQGRSGIVGDGDRKWQAQHHVGDAKGNLAGHHHEQHDSGGPVHGTPARNRQEAEKAVNAMIYQVAKEVGAMSIAIGGAVDAIVLTGGLARSDRVVGKLKKRVGHLAQVIIFRDNMEMEAMAAGALAVLRGQVEPRHYQLRLS